jgi:hypothetical protein
MSKNNIIALVITCICLVGVVIVTFEPSEKNVNVSIDVAAAKPIQSEGLTPSVLLVNKSIKAEIKQDNANHPSSAISAVHALYEQVEQQDYSQLEEFHQANLLCSSVKDYSTKQHYLADYGIYSDMDKQYAEQIFDDCEGISVKPFKSLTTLYSRAIKSGVKEAEFLLAVTYPPQFRKRYEWLSQSASWKPEAVDLLVQSLQSGSRVGDDKKLFWATVVKHQPLHMNSNFVAAIADYELSMQETQRLALIDLAAAWQNATSEQQRRAIIKRLNQ